MRHHAPDYSDEYMTTCWDCNGTGFTPIRLLLNNPLLGLLGDHCRVCGGEGRVYDLTTERGRFYAAFWAAVMSIAAKERPPV